jgi:hypothetical protein
VPGETPGTAGEDAHAPQQIARCVSKSHSGGTNLYFSQFPVRSADFQSAFSAIASAKPTASRRSCA